MTMKRIKELEDENKRLRDGAASIARGQELVDEFGDYEVLIEYLQGLRKNLSIAVEVLKYYADSDNWCDCYDIYNTDLKTYNTKLESDPEFYWPNRHKASFNRLRLELNKRYVKLSKIFRGLK